MKQNTPCRLPARVQTRHRPLLPLQRRRWVQCEAVTAQGQGARACQRFQRPRQELRARGSRTPGEVAAVCIPGPPRQEAGHAVAVDTAHKRRLEGVWGELSPTHTPLPPTHDHSHSNPTASARRTLVCSRRPSALSPHCCLPGLCFPSVLALPSLPLTLVLQMLIAPPSPARSCRTRSSSTGWSRKTSA